MSRVDSNYFPILISVALFCLCAFLLKKWYASGNYSGGDAAGNAMARGYAFLITFAIFTLSTIIFVGINIYLFTESSPLWLKLFGLSPIIPWAYIFSIEILEIDRYSFSFKTPEKYVFHYEVKTSRLLVNGRSHHRSNHGGGSSILPKPDQVDDSYIYSFRSTIDWVYFKMSMSDDLMEIDDYKVELEEVDLLPMTDWIPLQFIKNDSPETEAYVRYGVR